MIRASRNAYDHRLKQAVVETGDPDLFPELSIPESTRRTWMRRGVAEVISFDPADADVITLRATISKLRQRVAILTAVVRLLVTLVRIGGLSLQGTRIATARSKNRILNAVASAESIIGRRAALKVLGLTEGRLRAWKRKRSLCMLDDAPPCPRTHPGRLTRNEVTAMRDMVESDDLKHFSLRSLSLYGQRLGKVFASYGTWCRMVRAHGWRRPRRRLYPAKPKVGIRATRPNEWFHADVTIITLLDGTRCYLYGVIDGFSSSLIEKLWSQLRHRWLYLHQLDSFAGLERLVAAYFHDHNCRIPAMVLGGRTPDEAYFGRGADLPQRLREQHRGAQRQRALTNRAASCSACSSPDAVKHGGHPSVVVLPGPVP